MNDAAPTAPFAATERLLKTLETLVPGYPRELAVLTRLAAHLERRTVDAANTVLKPQGLNYSMYQVLVISLGSEQSELSLKELATATGERPTNVTHLCDELEKRGLLERRRDSTDRRRVYIRLTAAGRSLLTQLQPQMWAIWRRRYRGIGSAELKQQLQLLRRQYANLGGD